MSGSTDAQVVLLRHGATEWSASGRHTGRTDVALTADGERQAKHVIRWLAHFEFGLVLSSPLVRARRTAELVGFAGVGIDPDLQEWDYGGDEGLTTAQIRARSPGWSEPRSFRMRMSLPRSRLLRAICKRYPAKPAKSSPTAWVAGTGAPRRW